MIRSTPSSSGSGNITPASTRMAVSPQAITIMFMPNSPTPPSGTSSSGGASMPRNQQDSFVSSRPSVTTDNACGSQPRKPASNAANTDTSRRRHPGGWRRRASGGEPRIRRVLRPSAGTAGRSASRTITRADARKHQESNEFTPIGGAKQVGKPRQFCRVAASRAAATGSMPAAARASPRVAAAARRRSGAGRSRASCAAA